MEDYNRTETLLEDILEELKFLGQRVAELGEGLRAFLDDCSACDDSRFQSFRIRLKKTGQGPYDDVIGDW